MAHGTPAGAQLPMGLVDFVANQTGLGPAEILAINADHTIAVAELPRHHRDPFARLFLSGRRSQPKICWI